MKNTLLCGFTIGMVVGAYLVKKCPAAREVVDAAETAVKEKVEMCKEKINQAKQASKQKNQENMQSEQPQY